MGLLLLGKTKCALCGNIISNGKESVTLPAFSNNPLDSLHKYSDSSFHHECLASTGQLRELDSRVGEWANKTAPSARKCEVCGEMIANREDHLLIDYLSANSEDPMYAFNYTHLHKSCIFLWGHRITLLGLIKRAIIDGRLSDKHTLELIHQLEVGEN